MLINRKDWKVLLRFPLLDLPGIFDSTPIIPASSFKGALRHLLESRTIDSNIVRDLFGGDESLGLMKLSSLKYHPEKDNPNIETQFRVAISPKTGLVQADTLYEKRLMRDATFSGEVIILNGGTYPSVYVFSVINRSLPYLKIGRRNAHGIGVLQDFRFQRSMSEGSVNLNPIEYVFRQSTHEIVQLVAQNPELIYSLEWRDIERLMALVYEEIGFSVSLTKASQDGGKDLVLFCLSRSENGGKRQLKYYVELKHWKKGARVSNEPVSKLLEVSVRDGASGSIFLSTCGFTLNVRGGDTAGPNLYLGDLTTIRTLCQFYAASKSNQQFSTLSLEEICNVHNLSSTKAQQGAPGDPKTAARFSAT